jgi:ribokinase
MARSLDVLVIGGAGIDYLIRGDTLPSPSHSVTGDLFLRGAGGKGLNQAVAAARLGARSALVACIGRDPEGDDVLHALREARVNTDATARVRSMPTACTLICVDAAGRKQTASRPGANLALTEDRIAGERVTHAAVVVAQLEIPVETVLFAARVAKRAGAIFLLDAAPAADVPDELLALADMVTTNDEEAEALSGIDPHDRSSALAAARAIRARGARAVTVGIADGRAVVSSAGERWLASHPVAVVDTTGAGDACAAAIAVTLAEGGSVSDACARGHAAAALATTRVGALASLPFRAAVDARMAERGRSTRIDRLSQTH